jgi:hypothetical protein
MPPSVSALVLHGSLLPDSRPVRIGVRRVSVGGVFGVQGSEDLVRCPVKAVAQEKRTHEDKRQEHPPRLPLQNGPDVLHPSHLDGFSAFHLAAIYP